MINLDTPVVRAVPVDFFNNKSVVSLHAGLQYFFALARKQIKSIQEWSNDQLVHWLDNLGFQDYSKVVRYNEFTGAEFSTQAVDKNFLKETLGLTREDLQIKLTTEISKASKSRYLDYVLYGWGKNDWGQLGTFISNNIAIATTI